MDLTGIELACGGLATYAVTTGILYHPVIEGVKGRILDRVTGLGWLSLYSLLDYGFNCYICQSFWVSLTLSILLFKSFALWLPAWGLSIVINSICARLDSK